MKRGAASHWTHAELIAAAVDLQDLAQERRGHLEDCGRCRSDLERLQGRLQALGRTAAALAPAPGRTFRLPAGPAAGRGWLFRPYGAVAVSALLLMAAILGTHWSGYARRLFGPERPAVEAARFSMSIDALVDNALPQPYQSLAYFQELEVDETQSFLDQLEGLGPLIDDDVDEEDLFS